MINTNDSIRFTNVISRKYSFHYKEMDQYLSDFMDDIANEQLTSKGPLFYSLNNVPMDEMMNVEFFMPVMEGNGKNMEAIHFHSYYNVETMISICVHGDVHKNTEIAYKILIDYMVENSLQQITPIYHVLSGDETFQYVYIKIGVTQIA